MFDLKIIFKNNSIATNNSSIASNFYINLLKKKIKEENSIFSVNKCQNITYYLENKEFFFKILHQICSENLKEFIISKENKRNFKKLEKKNCNNLTHLKIEKCFFCKKNLCLECILNLRNRSFSYFNEDLFVKLNGKTFKNSDNIFSCETCFFNIDFWNSFIKNDLKRKRLQYELFGN
jgi:hypothetical protein